MSPVRKRADVTLELRTRRGEWIPILFRVDTGANLSTMNAKLAESPNTTNPDGLDLDTTLTPRKQTQRFADGSEREVTMYLGTLVVRFPELRFFVFRWECLFDPSPTPVRTPLLGLGGRILSDLSITFRGASRDYPSGSVQLEILAKAVPLFPSSDPLVRECRIDPLGWPKPEGKAGEPSP